MRDNGYFEKVLLYYTGIFSIIELSNNNLAQFQSDVFKIPLMGMSEYYDDYVAIGGSNNLHFKMKASKE